MPTFRGLRRGSANGACYDVGVSRSRTDSALVGGPGSHELSVNPKLEERAREEKRGRERWEILRFPTASKAVTENESFAYPLPQILWLTGLL